MHSGAQLIPEIYVNVLVRGSPSGWVLGALVQAAPAVHF